MGININSVKDQIINLSKEKANQLSALNADKVFDKKFITWKPELLISLRILSLSIAKYIKDGNETILSETIVNSGKDLKPKFLDSISVNAVQIASSFFYRYAEFGSKDIYNAEFTAFIEKDQKLKTYFTTFFDSIKGRNYNDYVEELHSLISGVENLDEEFLAEHEIPLDIVKPFNEKFLAIVDFVRKQVSNGNRTIAITSILTLQCTLVKAKAGIIGKVRDEGKNDMVFENIDELISNEEIYKAIREFDELCRCRRLAFNDGDYAIYLGYLLLYVYASVMQLNKKEISDFLGIKDKKAIDDISLIMASPSFAYNKLNEFSLYDEGDVAIAETIVEINKTIKRIETRSYGGSSSSSSSSDDDDISVMGVLGVVAGAAVLGYVGAVGYSYFTGQSTLGEAIDTVNTKIANTLGFGDGIKTL